ncbi:hypothetical protein [Vreelandella venusta]|uniref:hypothetical protein n=1 Tax=Vreelandella venusta TaxID=44935 RepID=UPI00200F8372|nr:hypothetical protein [Halomonas venusta]UQI38800.1 hypothetical protein M3L73_11175 [Halomonas venusta]
MSRIYAVHTTGGTIVRTLTTPHGYIECDDSVSDATHYVDVDASPHIIKARQPLDLQISVDDLTVTIEGLPAELTVITNGVETISDDEPLTITYDVPGTYEIRLSGSIQYLDTEVGVTVGDP